MFRDLEKDRSSLIKAIITLVYFMRGSIQYRDMLNMTPVERSLIDEFITDRLEIEKTKMYPVY